MTSDETTPQRPEPPDLDPRVAAWLAFDDPHRDAASARLDGEPDTGVDRDLDEAEVARLEVELGVARSAVADSVDQPPASVADAQIGRALDAVFAAAVDEAADRSADSVVVDGDRAGVLPPVVPLHAARQRRRGAWRPRLAVPLGAVAAALVVVAAMATVLPRLGSDNDSADTATVTLASEAAEPTEAESFSAATGSAEADVPTDAAADAADTEAAASATTGAAAEPEAPAATLRVPTTTAPGVTEAPADDGSSETTAPGLDLLPMACRDDLASLLPDLVVVEVTPHSGDDRLDVDVDGPDGPQRLVVDPARCGTDTDPIVAITPRP